MISILQHDDDDDDDDNKKMDSSKADAVVSGAVDDDAPGNNAPRTAFDVAALATSNPDGALGRNEFIKQGGGAEQEYG